MLIRPILEEWSFESVQKIKIDDLYVQFKSTPPPQLPQKSKKILTLKNLLVLYLGIMIWNQFPTMKYIAVK
jgi:hypothetical protein